MNTGATKTYSSLFISIFILPFYLTLKILGVILRNLKAFLKLFLFFSIFSTFGLAICFIYQVEKSTTEQFNISEYSKKISQLAKENQDLEIRAIAANSLNNANDLMAKLNFEKAEKISYVKVSGNSVSILKK